MLLGVGFQAVINKAVMGVFNPTASQVNFANAQAQLLKPVEPEIPSIGSADDSSPQPTVVPTEPQYTYNMVENPGPLADMRGQPAQNFAGGKYNATILTEDRIYYRAGESGKPLGQWFTTEPAESVAKVRIDTAVKPQWIDPKTGQITGTSIIDTKYAIKIPKGTTVYEGPVGYQEGIYLGGQDKMQIFIQEPWNLDVEIVSVSPLK